MIRATSIFFVLCLVLLLGIWTQSLRQENSALERRVHALEKKLHEQESELNKLNVGAIEARDTDQMRLNGNRQSLEAQLQSEREKIADLQRQLNEIGGGTGADSPDSHIADLGKQISDIQNQLNGLNRDAKIVDVRSRAYRQQQVAQQRQSKREISAQLATINQTLHDLNQQVQSISQDRSDPNRKSKVQELKAQMDSLREQRTQLQAQQHGLDEWLKQNDSAIRDEVAAEQTEVRADKQRELDQLAPLKVELDRWKKIKAEQAQMADKRKNLQQQIGQEQSKIKILNSALAALTDKGAKAEQALAK